VVVGPDAAGLRVQLTGIAAGSLVSARAALLGHGGQPLGSAPLAPDTDLWRIADLSAEARRLRVELTDGQGTVVVAEFPLSGSSVAGQ
jgi:hypothetical protein